MADLSEQVAVLTQLIEAGKTIEAMERFYANDVTMQENEQAPRMGKAVCLEHERRMLAGVRSMQAKLINQAVNEETGVVFSEWQYAFTDLSGQRFLLTEASVQSWRNELISTEKFYYSKVIQIP